VKKGNKILHFRFVSCAGRKEGRKGRKRRLERRKEGISEFGTYPFLPFECDFRRRRKGREGGKGGSFPTYIPDSREKGGREGIFWHFFNTRSEINGEKEGGGEGENRYTVFSNEGKRGKGKRGKGGGGRTDTYGVRTPRADKRGGREREGLDGPRTRPTIVCAETQCMKVLPLNEKGRGGEKREAFCRFLAERALGKREEDSSPLALE